MTRRLLAVVLFLAATLAACGPSADDSWPEPGVEPEAATEAQCRDRLDRFATRRLSSDKTSRVLACAAIIQSADMERLTKQLERIAAAMEEDTP